MDSRNKKGPSDSNPLPTTYISPYAPVSEDQKLQKIYQYLNDIKAKIADKKIYNSLLELMRSCNDKAINVQYVVSRASLLLAGHPDLIQGFYQFLPPGHNFLEYSQFGSGNNTFAAMTQTTASRTNNPHVAMSQSNPNNTNAIFATIRRATGDINVSAQEACNLIAILEDRVAKLENSLSMQSKNITQLQGEVKERSNINTKLKKRYDALEIELNKTCKVARDEEYLALFNRYEALKESNEHVVKELEKADMKVGDKDKEVRLWKEKYKGIKAMLESLA